jgi:hypothetical protein
MKSLLLSVLALVVATSPAAGQSPPPDLAHKAKMMPALPSARVVRLPLAQSSPQLWRPIGDVSVEPRTEKGAEAPRLTVRYERPARAAAGVSFVWPPGTLDGLRALRLIMSGTPRQRLRVCLTDTAGRVYAFPSITVLGTTQAFVLRPDTLAFDPYQNAGRRKAPPVLADMIMLTILDINGYMSTGRPECAWEIVDVQAELGRAADAQAAADLFYRSLTREPGLRDASLEALTAAYAREPGHPRLPLLLGMAHLRMAAEEGSDEHAAHAEALLAIAARRDPADGRIPGWRHSVGYVRARNDGRDQDAATHLEALRAAFADDACFHGVSLGIALFDQPHDSAAFAEGLAAMRAPMECAEGDPTGANGALWPHNVQGYLLALCDYELKADQSVRADTVLMALEASDGFEDWPFRSLVETRRKALDARPGSHGFVLAPGATTSCTICHLASP